MGIVDNNAPSMRRFNGVSVKKTVGAVFKVCENEGSTFRGCRVGLGDFCDTQNGVDSMKYDGTYGAIVCTSTALMFGTQGGIAGNVLCKDCQKASEQQEKCCC